MKNLSTIKLPRRKWPYVLLAFAALISFLLIFEKIADQVWLWTHPGKPLPANNPISNWARCGLELFGGYIIISVGVSCLGFPLLGIPLILLGIGIFAWGGYSFFQLTKPAPAKK